LRPSSPAGGSSAEKKNGIQNQFFFSFFFLVIFSFHPLETTIFQASIPAAPLAIAAAAAVPGTAATHGFPASIAAPTRGSSGILHSTGMPSGLSLHFSSLTSSQTPKSNQIKNGKGRPISKAKNKNKNRNSISKTHNRGLGLARQCRQSTGLNIAH
jgi:hypothetical protein